MWMMRPHLARRMAGKHRARAQERAGDVDAQHVAPIRRAESGRTGASRAWRRSPALLIRMSMRPNSPLDLRHHRLRSTAGRRHRSSIASRLAAGRSVMSCATACALSALRSAMTAIAPAMREGFGEHRADALSGAGDDGDAAGKRGLDHPTQIRSLFDGHRPSRGLRRCELPAPRARPMRSTTASGRDRAR